MKKIGVCLLVSLFSQLGLSSTALADVMCSGDGYSVYCYPGARPDGTRVQVAELDGPDGDFDSMKCDRSCTTCVGKKYSFRRTIYDARIGSSHGLVAVMKCSQ